MGDSQERCPACLHRFSQGAHVTAFVRTGMAGGHYPGLVRNLRSKPESLFHTRCVAWIRSLVRHLADVPGCPAEPLTHDGAAVAASCDWLRERGYFDQNYRGRETVPITVDPMSLEGMRELLSFDATGTLEAGRWLAAVPTKWRWLAQESLADVFEMFRGRPCTPAAIDWLIAQVHRRIHDPVLRGEA